MSEMYKITVTGIVQGVGFRPFVYRLARSMNLKGYVKNVGDGSVEIVIDGKVEKFIERLKKELPLMARIDNISVEIENKKVKMDDFKIVESGGKYGKLSLPPPDIAICKECLGEVFNELKSSRRHLYPFTTCTSCGQRFSISFRLPFDRENTTLSDFPMCYECRKEYLDVNDRRYYAQSIACPICGPEYSLKPYDIKGIDAIKKASQLIDDGKIIAIKGIAGIHIACKTESKIVKKLRVLLKRPQQPFAVMVRDLRIAERVAKINNIEKRELESYVRPIVILKKRRKENDLEEVAPGLDTIGIMLPYTALHFILFHFLESDILVMTSANISGEPMAIDLHQLPERLKIGCDAILDHNMVIANRVDDSVIKIVNGRRMLIRRSRGFVPTAIDINVGLNKKAGDRDKEKYAIAFGAELYNSIALLKEGKVVMSQYIGDTSNFKTFNEFFKPSLEFFIKYLDIEPDIVIADMHPAYLISQYAEKFAKERGIELLKIQHHFAHALSVMAEHKMDEAVAITVDGAGYGVDGTIWGGEVLYINMDSMEFQRVGRLEKIKLLGGDLATYHPIRVLFSLVYSHEGDYSLLKRYSKYLKGKESFELFKIQYDQDFNVAYASSAGRIFDATSAMLEVCFERTYEGEPAMKLEAVAKESESYYKPMIEEKIEISRFNSLFSDKGKRGEVYVIKVEEVFVDALKRYLNGEKKSVIAYQIIDYLAKSFSEIVEKFDAPVVLSGGVAYNSHFQRALNVEYITNELVPAGDNGISLGQLYSLKTLEEL